MSALAVPVQVQWTVTASGQAATALPATPLQVRVAQVHIGLKGEKGDRGEQGLSGEVNPQIPVLVAQAQTAATAASASAAAADAVVVALAADLVSTQAIVAERIAFTD